MVDFIVMVFKISLVQFCEYLSGQRPFEDNISVRDYPPIIDFFLSDLFFVLEARED